MGFISAIDLSILLFLTGPLAIQVQDRRTAIRWICGLVSVVFMSAIKTATFLTKMSDDKLVIKVLFFSGNAAMPSSFLAAGPCWNCIESPVIPGRYWLVSVLLKSDSSTSTPTATMVNM